MQMLEQIRNFFYNDSQNLNIFGKIGLIILVIILAAIVVKLAHSIIFRKLSLPDQVVDSKVNTMKSIIYNVVKVVVIFVAAMTILETIGVNTASLIATAGIGGVAIGFGAQYIVRDYISGSVIIAEDQYRVGELVDIEGFEGYVEEVGLRLTKIRAFNGNLHIIQNGEIKAVTNKSRGAQRVWTDIYVDKLVDQDIVFQALDKAIERMNTSQEYKDHIEVDFTSLGMTGMTEFDAIYSLKGMVEPGYQWSIDYDLRELAMEELGKAGIDLIE